MEPVASVHIEMAAVAFYQGFKIRRNIKLAVHLQLVLRIWTCETLLPIFNTISVKQINFSFCTSWHCSVSGLDQPTSHSKSKFYIIITPFMCPENGLIFLAVPSQILTPFWEGPFNFILTAIICDVLQSMQINSDITSW